MQVLERERTTSNSRPHVLTVAPYEEGDDAVELVTDGLAIDAVIQRLVDLFRERVPEDAWRGPSPLQEIAP